MKADGAFGPGDRVLRLPHLEGESAGEPGLPRKQCVPERAWRSRLPPSASMESKTIRDRRGLLNRRCQGWHVDRDHYSPLRGPGNARWLGAQSRVCAAQSGILSPWRPGSDFTARSASGKLAVCKTATAGSIPALASKPGQAFQRLLLLVDHEHCRLVLLARIWRAS